MNCFSGCNLCNILTVSSVKGKSLELASEFPVSPLFFILSILIGNTSASFNSIPKLGFLSCWTTAYKVDGLIPAIIDTLRTLRFLYLYHSLFLLSKSKKRWDKIFLKPSLSMFSLLYHLHFSQTPKCFFSILTYTINKIITENIRQMNRLTITIHLR